MGTRESLNSSALMTDCLLLDFLGSKGAGSADGLVICFRQGCWLRSLPSWGVKGDLSTSASRPKKVSFDSVDSDLCSSCSASLSVGLSFPPLFDFFDSDRLIAWFIAPMFGFESRFLRGLLALDVLRWIVGRRMMPFVPFRAGLIVHVGWNIAPCLAEHGI